MQSLEQERVSNEAAPVSPKTVIEHNMGSDMKDTTVENTVEKMSFEAPHTEAVSQKEEAREGDTSQHTSEAERETRRLASQEVQDSPSSEIYTDRDEKGSAQGQSGSVKVEAPDSALDSGQDAPRWSSSAVESYAIQCNSCFKWRVIPSKEKYEAIGEHILEDPFVCAKAQEWRENVTCDDIGDLNDNEPTILWAVDKHNIPCPPKGFYRKVVLRAENAKKFADVYYRTPCGKTLRSMVQVQKYLNEHPELGARITQFAFTSPKARADVSGAGVPSKSPLKDETQSSTESRKRMKGSTQMAKREPLKASAHGQPPRPRPLTGEGPHVKPKSLSASKPNALPRQKPKSEQDHASKSGPHPMMGVKKEKSELDREGGKIAPPLKKSPTHEQQDLAKSTAEQVG